MALTSDSGSREQKWSSLLASSSDTKKIYNYYRYSAIKNTGLNEYSVIAIEKALQQFAKKQIFEISIDNEIYKINAFLRVFGIEKESIGDGHRARQFNQKNVHVV